MRWRLAVGLAAVLVAVGLVLPGHIVRRYALYVADGRGVVTSPYRLFLDPYPDAVPCARQADAIDHEGGHARCTSYLAVTVDSRLDDEIATDFSGVAGSWFALCTAITRVPAPPGRVRITRTKEAAIAR